MKVVVTANGTDLNAPASPVFGRCLVYVFVDTATMQFEGIENPEIDTLRGTGIEAARFVIERGARAVVTGNVGPNAFGVLQASCIPVYLFGGGTVREAIGAFRAGQLERIREANVPTHSGTGKGIETRIGRGSGMAHRTWGVGGTTPDVSLFASRKEGIAFLKETARELREQLAQVQEQLEQLENED